MAKITGFYKKKKDKKERRADRSADWAVKIVVLTFILSLISSVLSQVAVGGSDILIATMLLIFMIITSIIFDVIGVSVTSCTLCALSDAHKESDGVKNVALALIANAEKVNNFCADVIGDICGVMSGACGASIVAAISQTFGLDAFLPSILVSAVIASVTVGGKALCKRIAVRNSESIVLFTSRRLYSLIKTFKRKH